MNPSFQWQVWFLRPNYHFEFPGPVDVRGSGSDRRRGGSKLAVSAGRRGWRDGLGPKRNGYLPGLYCIRGQVDLWQTHTILICAQPDNASQGQNSSAQCFLTGCFFNYMSEAIKLRRRFSHKALFYVLVITVNYKQQEKRLMEGKCKKKSGFIHFHTLVFYFHPVGTLIICKPYQCDTVVAPWEQTWGRWPGKRLFTLTSMCEYMRPPFITQREEKQTCTNTE